MHACMHTPTYDYKHINNSALIFDLLMCPPMVVIYSVIALSKGNNDTRPINAGHLVACVRIVVIVGTKDGNQRVQVTEK